MEDGPPSDDLYHLINHALLLVIQLNFKLDRSTAALLLLWLCFFVIQFYVLL